MAGILDFLNTPDAQLGIGLLAAGGPTTDPNQTGFGQRIAAGMQSTRNSQLQQAQLREAQQAAAIQNFQLQRMQNWYGMAANGLSAPGAGDATTNAAPMGGSNSPPASGSSPMGQAPSGAPQAPVASAPGGGVGSPLNGPTSSGQAPSGGFPFVLPGKTEAQSRYLAGMMGEDAYMKAYMDQTAPGTDIQKLMAAMKIDPASPQGQAMLQDAAFKANNVPLTSTRPDGGLYNQQTGEWMNFPKAPLGSVAIKNQDGTFSYQQVKNAPEAIQSTASNEKRGANLQTNTVAFANGKPIFSTAATDTDRANGVNAAFNNIPPAQGGLTSSFQGSPETVLPLIAGMKDPQERANAYDAYSRQLTNGGPTQGAPAPAAAQNVTPVLSPGADKAANLDQEALAKTRGDLESANAAAPTVISRLQNIKLLAPGAINGAESARRDFYNGLLTLLPDGTPGKEGAQTAAAASDLVDKNSAQIVAALRMGAGGAGTDAFQNLASAGNPNRTMQLPAIQEAADQLIAGQKLNQARSQVLMPSILSKDATGLQQKQLAFDAAADPRIWQWQNIQDPTARKAFAAQLAKTDPSIPGKIKTLEGLGAIK